MNLTIYSTKSPENSINKVLEGAVSLTGTLKTPSTILNPIITVKTNKSYFTKNYLYIPDFGRYYFIKNIEVEGPVSTITASIDVLETYKNQISDTDFLIGRQEYKYNNRLKDPYVQVYTDTQLLFKKVGVSPFGGTNLNNRTIVLITATA